MFQFSPLDLILLQEFYIKTFILLKIIFQIYIHIYANIFNMASLELFKCYKLFFFSLLLLISPSFQSKVLNYFLHTNLHTVFIHIFLHHKLSTELINILPFCYRECKIHPIGVSYTPYCLSSLLSLILLSNFTCSLKLLSSTSKHLNTQRYIFPIQLRFKHLLQPHLTFLFSIFLSS